MCRSGSGDSSSILETRRGAEEVTAVTGESGEGGEGAVVTGESGERGEGAVVTVEEEEEEDVVYLVSWWVCEMCDV